MKVCFVILHYKDYSVTCDCVDSIKKVLGKQECYRVVVVDNYSNNGSAEALSKKYGGGEN